MNAMHTRTPASPPMLPLYFPADFHHNQHHNTTRMSPPYSPGFAPTTNGAGSWSPGAFPAASPRGGQTPLVAAAFGGSPQYPQQHACRVVGATAGFGRRRLGSDGSNTSNISLSTDDDADDAPGLTFVSATNNHANNNGFNSRQVSASAALNSTRSTKGASKQRRDLINSEITYLRETLPLPDSARQRLSQLQVMSLACCYIRKCNYFTRLFGNIRSGETDAPFEFAQAMTGFLLITTREGKLLYISDNVTEYLGHSMVDMMTQGDSLYDIIDKRDHSTVQGELLQPNYTPSIGEEKTFFCRMNVSRSFRRHAGFGDHKTMHIRGHFIQPLLGDHYGSQPVFMATCTPLVTPDVKENSMEHNTLMFQSVHGLDMSYIEIAPNAEFHLGYTDAEMKGKSWYGLLHPEDIHEAKEKHLQLVKSSHEMGCMLTARLQAASGSWVWCNIVMHIRQPFVCDNGDPAIVCKNHVISESEAAQFKIQSQLYSSHIARSPEFLGGPGNASPPHSITQLGSSDGESMQSSAYPGSADDQGVVSFLGQIDVIPTSSPQQQVPQQGDGGYQQQQVPQQTQLADHTKQQQQPASPQQLDHKQRLRNHLKRKMQTTEDCKPLKQARVSASPEHQNGNDFFGNFTITGSIVAQPVMFQESSGLSVGQTGGFGGMLDVQAAPIYSQLATIKKEVIMPESPATVSVVAPSINPKAATTTMVDVQHPMTPLTPESMTLESQDDSITTQLCVDVHSDAAVVPTSMLTPESSPQSSPTHSANITAPGTNYDLDNLSFFDNDSKKLSTAKQAPEQPKKTSMSMSEQLSDLDAILLENFFKDMPSALVRPTVPHTNPQSRIAEIAAALKESELIQQQQPIRNMTPPAAAIQVPVVPTQIPVTVSALDHIVPSPQHPLTCNSPATSSGPLSPESLTESLLDLVRLTGSDNLTMADLAGNFMLVPGNDVGSSSSGEVTAAEDAIMSYLDASLSEGAASPLGGDIEFQQLEDFSANSPSHGEVDQLSKTVFDSTL